jgi:transcription antitermination factor NusA-like protein
MLLGVALFNHSDEREWRHALKPGDKVIVESRYRAYISEVDRVTKTQIISGNYKYRITDGYRVGCDRWGFVSIRMPTKARIDQIRFDNKRAEMLDKAILVVDELRKKKWELKDMEIVVNISNMLDRILKMQCEEIKNEETN